MFLKHGTHYPPASATEYWCDWHIQLWMVVLKAVIQADICYSIQHGTYSQASKGLNSFMCLFSVSLELPVLLFFFLSTKWFS
jgi:hypothetical protein